MAFAPVSQASESKTKQQFNLKTYHGQIVVLDFWASWCVPCRKSFPWLNQMQAKYGQQGLVVVGVNLDRERAAAERFLKKIPANFEILYDPKAKLSQAFKVTSLPRTVILGRDGKQIGGHVGFYDSKIDEYEHSLRASLQGLQ